jgi:cytochrome P450
MFTTGMSAHPTGARSGLPSVEHAFQSGSVFDAPHDVYRTLRETAPVYWSPYLGQWLVTSHELVLQVLGQPRAFSSFGFDTGYIRQLPDETRARTATLEHHFEQRGLIQLDPPDHARLRRALQPHFTARVIAGLEDLIRARVADLLEDRDGGLDVIADFAGPLPVRVIADLLGVGEDERDGFPRWSRDAVRFFGTPLPDPTYAEDLDRDLVQWRALLERLLRARAKAPRDDLLSAVAELVETGSITLEEALFTCAHFLIAGHETTTNMIGNAMFCLITHPDELKALLDEPALIEGALEEVLRYEPPIQRVRRVATEMVELGGATIDAGEPVIPVLAAANRDPARFEDPDRFDVRRPLSGSANRHVAFGHSIHLCIGAPLARLEGRLALPALLECCPVPSLPVGFVPRWRRTINLRGLESLPISPRRATILAH